MRWREAKCLTSICAAKSAASSSSSNLNSGIWRSSSGSQGITGSSTLDFEVLDFGDDFASEHNRGATQAKPPMKDFLFALGRAPHPMLQRVKTPLLEHLRDVPSVTQIT